MPTLAEMKAMSPAYSALTDQEFADRVYQKHYAGKIDRAEFDKRTAPVSMINEIASQPVQGFNSGLDALINFPGSVLNLGAGALGYDAPFKPVKVFERFNSGEEPKTATGRILRAAGEVAGGSVLPTGGIIAAGARAATGAAQGGSAVARGIQGIAQRAAADPKRFAAMEGVASAGAGTGVGLAREDNAGPIAELGAGVLGGIVAPLGYSALARTGGAVRDAAKYGTNMASRARNPQLAADQDVADALSKSGLTADDVRAELAPKLSKQLQARNPNLTDADAADIVSRVAAKEPAAAIARDYGISESTVNAYAKRHREMTPTPRNIVDVTKDLAGDGASKPITRLGRAAFGIADDGETTQALTSRQDTQGGRLNTIIKKAAGGRDYDAETARLDDELGAQAKQAYAVANQNAQPFNLRPALRQARKSAFESAGDIRTGLEKAVDLFFEPVMAGSRVRKLGQPISDMKRFQASREALDQMIETSFKDGKPTRLTRKLTQLRQSVNNVVRNSNPDMAAADDMFSGAKSSQAIMKQGQELTTRLGAKTADALKGFDKLNPDQKDLYRLSFLQKLDNMVANPRDGAGLANQFQSEAVRKVIRRLFAPDKRLSAKENKAIRARGEELIKRTREEATTTKTLNEVTGRGNSPTAPWQQDMGKFMAGAKAGADVLTGRWGAVLDNLTNRLTYQIGERQAKAIMETLAETDPSKVLPMLNRLARQAKTTKERMEYVTAIRQFRKAGPGSSLGTGIVAADQH
jgi:hypothetical protein